MWEYIAEDSLIFITFASSFIKILVNTRTVFCNVIDLDTHTHTEAFSILERDFSSSLSSAVSAINVERHFFCSAMK